MRCFNGTINIYRIYRTPENIDIIVGFVFQVPLKFILFQTHEWQCRMEEGRVLSITWMMWMRTVHCCLLLY
jgi:hypothetical protein